MWAGISSLTNFTTVLIHLWRTSRQADQPVLGQAEQADQPALPNCMSVIYIVISYLCPKFLHINFSFQKAWVFEKYAGLNMVRGKLGRSVYSWPSIEYYQLTIVAQTIASC